MNAPKKKPRLMTEDLEQYIEKIHLQKLAEAEAERKRRLALKEGWSSRGGRAFLRFIETRPAETTRRAYLQHIEDFLLWIARNAGGIDPLDATPEDLARYETYVSQHVSAFTKRRLALRTRQERVRTLRTAFAFCVDEDVLDRSPARYLRITGRAQPKRTFLTDEQAVALITACWGDRLSDLRDRSLIVFLLHSGLRAAEAAQLRWDDIDERSPITVTIEGKGRVVRTVPVSSEAYRTLQEWRRVCDNLGPTNAFVWRKVTHRLTGGSTLSSQFGVWSLTDEPLNPKSVHSIVTRRAAKAGLKDASPHTLRRTYATKLKRLGVSIDTISRYLGHASIVTTVNYFSPQDEEATQTVQTLNYSLGSKG